MLTKHFQQKGVYFSASPFIGSLDFASTDRSLLWTSGTHYCVLGFIQDNFVCRRTQKYQGKRFFNRGVDEAGNASNQLLCQVLTRVEANGERKLQVQNVLRGQMPVRFSQAPNMGPKPKIEVTG